VPPAMPPRSQDPRTGALPGKAPFLKRLYIGSAIVIGIVLFASAIPGLRNAFRRTPWDLNVDYLSAQAYLQHYSPFTPEGAKRSGVAIAGPAGLGHPPTNSFWALPLAGMDIHTAGRVLGGITLVLVLLEAFVAMRLLEFPAPLATAWVATAYLAGCSFMDYHLGLGQISGPIGFLFFVAWWAARKGNDVLAGMAVGAACTLKLFPGVMVIFLLVTRRWRAVAAAIAFYLVIAAVMTARFGLAAWMRFLSVQSAVADFWMGNIQNQSIHGIVTHIFEPVCVAHGPVNHRAMVVSTALSIALLVAASRWTSRHHRQRFDLSFALFTTLSVLMSQWVWEHYAIIYLLPVLVLAAELRRRWRDQNRVAASAMAFALLAIVASWRLDVHTKQELQRAVQSGRLDHHLQLHVFDVLNWAPGILLLGILSIACWRGPKQTYPGTWHR
jgi:Glycosyltransferase family 87